MSIDRENTNFEFDNESTYCDRILAIEENNNYEDELLIDEIKETLKQIGDL